MASITELCKSPHESQRWRGHEHWFHMRVLYQDPSQHGLTLKVWWEFPHKSRTIEAIPLKDSHSVVFQALKLLSQHSDLLAETHLRIHVSHNDTMVASLSTPYVTTATEFCWPNSCPGTCHDSPSPSRPSLYLHHTLCSVEPAYSSYWVLGPGDNELPRITVPIQRGAISWHSICVNPASKTCSFHECNGWIWAPKISKRMLLVTVLTFNNNQLSYLTCLGIMYLTIDPHLLSSV